MESTPSRRKRLRRYLRDASAPIPRTTLWRYGKLTQAATVSPSASESTSLSESTTILTPTQSCATPKSTLTTDPLEHHSDQLESEPDQDLYQPLYSEPETNSEPDMDLVEQDTDSETDMPNSVETHTDSELETDSDTYSETNSGTNSEPETNSDTDSEPDDIESVESVESNQSNDSEPDTDVDIDEADPLLDDPNLFQPLYPNATITLCGALCAVMKFCIDNKLTYTAIRDLFKLLFILCPQPNLLPTSLHKLKDFFEKFRPIHKHQQVCMKCKKTTCSCGSRCHSDIAHIVHLDIHEQLQELISRNWKSLKSHTTNSSHQLRDVWDGSALRPLCSTGRFFSDKYNLAVSLSTDGVPLYKSSTMSIWPVYALILNLPARIRMKGENILLCGLWVGTKKPFVDLFLKPIAEAFQRISSIGLPIRTSVGTITARAKVVMGVFDLPAKATVLCAKRFNGKYGCSVCLHPGKRLSNNSRVYLPTYEYPERTHAQVLANGIQAKNSNSCVQGIFSPSPLSSILDLVASFPVDYMHAVLEGVTRWLLKSWFNSKYHKKPFYLGRSVLVIDRELLEQRPPNEFSRVPRSIKKHLKFWKATELRNWLLFYSLPILLDFLPSLYWHHFSLLVCAMHILINDQTTLPQVAAAEQMLSDFVLLLPELYGERSCTANAHLLTHLAKFVRLWGPLWTQSAFGFENRSGQLKHLFHGKTNIVPQLLFNLDVCFTVKKVYRKLIRTETVGTLNYIDSKLSLKSNMKLIREHTYIVGKQKVSRLTAEQFNATGITTGTVFYRMMKNSTLYHSTAYRKSKTGKRDNTYCQYKHGTSVRFGRIELFLHSPIQSHALIRQLHPRNTSLSKLAGPTARETLSRYQDVDLLNDYIFPVDLPADSDELSAVPLELIMFKVVLISASGHDFCVVQPNNFEY